MIIITFPDQPTKCRALGYLSCRFAFKSWATGEVMVPEDALGQLIDEGIPFTTQEPIAPHTDVATMESRDEWERGLLAAARPWGVAFSDASVSSEGLYD